MKLREEEFYEQYHQHGGTTIIPTEIFNELYDDATEEIERLNNDIKELLKENENKEKVIKAQDNIIKEVREYIHKNCISSDEWTDLDFCHFIPTGKIIYKQLTPKKVKELLQILDKVGD